MLKIGTKAPSFTLEDRNGTKFSLSDFLGKKVVLYFYSKDNTSACTKQAIGFGELNDEFEKENVKIIGISKDAPATHGKFIDKYSLPFLLLSDVSLETLNDYGVWQEKKMCGKTCMGTVRTTFVIDENGNIEKIFEKVKAEENPKDVLEYLKNHN